MEYLLKASVVITIFYLCFHLLLKKETFFNKNRWFLLIGIVIALIFPFVIIPVQIAIEPIIATDNNFVFTENSLSVLSVSTPEVSFEWQSLLPLIYSIGFLIFTIQFLLQFGSLIWLLLKNPKNKDGIYTYVIVNNKISPFSFFKWIVYNPESFTQSELDLMMTHEKVHASQLHSIDILLIQLVCCIFWFNPLIWLYRKEIRQNLEFIADYQTQKSLNNQKEYQRLLLKTSVANHNISFSNNFYNSSIKERIIMLKTSRSKRNKQWKYLLILPLLAGLLMSMNTEKVYIEAEPSVNIISSNSENLVAIITKDTKDSELEEILKEFKQNDVVLSFDKLKRNNVNEITNLATSLYDGNYGGNYNNKEAIESFMIYIERAGNKGTFIGRIGGASLKFESLKEEASEEIIEAFLIKVYKAILNSGIQTEEELKALNITLPKNLNTIEFAVTKNTTDSELKSMTQAVEKKGGTLLFSSIKRNSKNELTSIFLKLNNHSYGGGNSTEPLDSFIIYKEFFGLEGGYVGRLNGATLHFNNAEKIHDKEAISALQKIANNAILKLGIQTKEELEEFENKKAEHKNKKSNKKEDRQTNIGTIHVNNDGDDIRMDIDTDNNKDSNSIYYIKTDNNGKNGKKSKLLINSKNKKPLFIVDGEILSENDASFVGISAESIKSVNVLKGKDATDKYGEKGKNGVIIITSKTEEELQLETNNPKINKPNSKSISTNEGDVITIKESKSDNNLRINSGMYNNPQPLILVDGNEVSKEAMKALNPKHIESMQVFKGNDAKEKYGEKGKNGVILIKLKKSKKQNFESEIKQIESVRTETSSISSTNNADKSKNTSIAYISKFTTDKTLNEYKINFKKIGITINYSKLKRNNSGEITAIKMSLKDEKGNKSSAAWKVNEGIPNIEFGKYENTLIARTKK